MFFKLSTKHLIILFFLLLILLLFLGFYLLLSQVASDKLNEIGDETVMYFRSILNEEKSKALSVAITLAENEALKNALMDDDEELGFALLSKTLDKLKRYTAEQDMRAQIITKDLTIFARSWDNSFAGMPLEGFREDLGRITQIQKPRVAIETGRLLTLRASAPIKDGVKTVGYLEIIRLFDNMTRKLRDQGIETLVLMNAKFLDIATLMRENPMIGDFVVSNRHYSHPLLDQLKKLDLDLLLAERNRMIGDSYYMVEPMMNGIGQKIGIFLLVIDIETLERLKRARKSVSYFVPLTSQQLREVVKIWENPAGTFKSVYDKELFFLLSSVDSEDRIYFEDEIRKQLTEYTKEELINILLEREQMDPLRGEIR